MLLFHAEFGTGLSRKEKLTMMKILGYGVLGVALIALAFPFTYIAVEQYSLGSSELGTWLLEMFRYTSPLAPVLAPVFALLGVLCFVRCNDLRKGGLAWRTSDEE